MGHEDSIAKTRPSAALRGPGRVARSAFIFVAVAVLANLGFNLWLGSQGLGAPFNSKLLDQPFNTFLYDPRDRFADMLKMAMGYPGPPIHPADPRWGLDLKLDHFQQQVAAFKGTSLNHFHMLPLATLIGLGLRAALSAIDPGWLVAIVLATAAAALAAVVVRESPRGQARLWFPLLAILSYPVMFAFDRGHIFALICGICTIAAIARSVRLGKADFWSIALFVIAINIRPNIALIPIAFFMFRLGWSFRDLTIAGVASVGLFLAGMAAAHAIYPAYHLASFLAGLGDYSRLNLIQGFGTAYNNSLFGALSALFGYRKWVFVVPLLLATGLFLATLTLARRREVPPSILIYLTLSALVLGSQVVPDYHMIVFLVPLILLAREWGGDPRARTIVLIGTCLILSPKNYINHVTDYGVADWSWQTVINPLVLIVTSVILCYQMLRRQRGHSGVPELAQA